MTTDIDRLSPLLPPHMRTAFLGVGAWLRSDDYAGMAVIDGLTAAFDPALCRDKGILFVSGSTAPENCVGQLRAFAPDAVIVIDAARMGLLPGDCALIDPQSIAGATFCTHMLPLPVTLSYLECAIGCVTAYIGVEPLSTEQGIGMSEPVEEGVNRLVAKLTAMLAV